ncbi:hypothetical protein ACEPAI_8954 [Sanghuangporus weigelae]
MRGLAGNLMLRRSANSRSISTTSTPVLISSELTYSPSMSLLLAQAFAVVTGVYLIQRWFLRGQSLKNVPGPPRTSWLKGYFFQLFDASEWKFHDDMLHKYGGVVRLPMMLGKDDLYISDPLALHHILVKDQYIYEETSSFLVSNALTLGLGLVSTFGDHHRRQRKMLNPVFSMRHMRDLLPVFYPIAYDLRDILLKRVRDEPKEIDLMSWLSRAALEYIGQAGFGYTFNALHDEKSSEYGDHVKKTILLIFKTEFPRRFLPWLVKLGPPAFRRKMLECVPSKLIKEFIESIDRLDDYSKSIYEKSKRALEKGDEALLKRIGQGKDILSVLLKANMSADEKDRLPEEEIIGQLNTFTAAGQDSTSHALSRALHLLALHPDVQKCLRDEIIAARTGRGGADFDYDILMGLPYLDAFCRETLRVFPPVIFLARTTRKDVIMPLAWPILGADGKTEITEIPVKRNTNIYISIYGANRSKKIWGEDAEEWKPERWLNPLPESVSKAHLPGVYSSMMTFFGGGRACIGFKFAEMEMKLVLTVLLESLAFEPGPELEWEMSGITRSVLKNSEDKTPQLPLKVSLFKGN